jgi:drug/metabolite transporter (DMT)-like permease
VIVLLYALVCLIWGSTWLAIKLGLEGVPPFWGAGLRFVLAAVILWLMALASGQRLRLSPNGRKAAATAGLLNFGVSYALVYWSETRIDSGIVAVLYSLMPLVTALMTAFVTKTETLTPGKTAGVVLGSAGVAALFWPEAGGGTLDLPGLLAALLSSLVAAVNLVAQSVWSKSDDARLLNAWSMSIGAGMLLALSFLFEGGRAVTWTPANAGALLYLATAGSVVAFLAYYRLIRLLPATQVSLITLIFPVVALVLGAVFREEKLSAHAGLGIGLIFAGVTLALAAGRLKR